MTMIELTDDNFQKEVLESSTPVLVDFWAVWCGPCRAIAPLVEEIARDYEGKLKVGKTGCGRAPGRADTVRHTQHSDPDGVQEREGG